VSLGSGFVMCLVLFCDVFVVVDVVMFGFVMCWWLLMLFEIVFLIFVKTVDDSEKIFLRVCLD